MISPHEVVVGHVRLSIGHGDADGTAHQSIMAYCDMRARRSALRFGNNLALDVI